MKVTPKKKKAFSSDEEDFLNVLFNAMCDEKQQEKADGSFKLMGLSVALKCDGDLVVNIGDNSRFVETFFGDVAPVKQWFEESKQILEDAHKRIAMAFCNLDLDEYANDKSQRVSPKYYALVKLKGVESLYPVSGFEFATGDVHVMEKENVMNTVSFDFVEEWKPIMAESDFCEKVHDAFVHSLLSSVRDTTESFIFVVKKLYPGK